VNLGFNFGINRADFCHVIREIEKFNSTNLIEDLIKFIFEKVCEQLCQDSVFEAAIAIPDRNQKVSVRTRDIKCHVHLVPELYEWLIHNATRVIFT